VRATRACSFAAVLGGASVTAGALEVQGCRLAFHVEGAGPPIVFIQGVGVCGRGWTPQVSELRARFACLHFDNRGMGSSQPAGRPITVEQMADDALALMSHSGWESAHVVGHSLGGPVALDLALRHAGRVRSLSLLCTIARGADATRLSWRMLSIGFRSRIGPRRARRRAFMEIVMPRGAVPDSEADRVAGELAKLFGHDLADQPPIAMPQLRALRRYDATGRLPRLAGIPTLVLSAAHDPIAPPRFGRALAASIPGARFVEFPDAAHGLPIQHAAAVNTLLAEHFDHVESSRV
jgi:pimeloyl-ACP methyl ester carboxylesterase